MRIYPYLSLAIVASMVTTLADEPSAPPMFADLPPREAALEHLLSERESPEALTRAIEAALKQGVGEQAILEARFLYHVDRGEDEALAALAPEFVKRRETWKIDESEIFAVREDWLAVVEYVQAIAALVKGDRDAFKKHITEAFWLSPRQGAAFAPHIDRMRLEDAMRAITLDFAATRLTPLAGGEARPLSAYMERKKAMLIHFWSPWSRESEASMPDFVTLASDLLSKDVAVVSILPERSEKVVAEARKMVAELGSAPSGVWLLDQSQRPLSRDLRVQNIPVMILVSTDGKIIFNGHPTDDALWTGLAEINPDFKRPFVPDREDEP